MDLPERGIDPAWLALREPADARARQQAVQAVLPPLLGWLDHRADSGLRIVDLGAGTGANLRWLAPRLARPNAQHWTLVDHDPRLAAWGPVPFTQVRADVADLDRLVAESGGVDLVTAAALLDLLDDGRLARIVAAVVAARAPALFSLTVTGEVTLDPPDPADDEIRAAFDAHQRRGSRPGPNAGAAVAALFRRHGWSVLRAPTPWVLRPGDAALVDQWLEGRAAAGAEQRPDLAPEAARWLARRRAQVRTHELTAVVGHVDVLALPV